MSVGAACDTEQLEELYAMMEWSSDLRFRPAKRFVTCPAPPILAHLDLI